MDKYFHEGVDAHRDDKSRDENPYPVGSQEHIDWEQGFLWHIEWLELGRFGGPNDESYGY